MRKHDPFFREVMALAVPTALQSMLQSSFSVVDQLMIGRLGEVSIAGVGLAGKFASVYSVLVAAFGAVAGIMMAQYLGQRNAREVRRSFLLNLALALGLAGIFTAICIFFPNEIMRLYTKDAATAREAARYLAVISATFLPMAGTTLLSAYFRCTGRAKLPLYASAASAVVNTGLNYLLIFGKCGLPALGAVGAGIATAASQGVNLLLMLILLPRGTEHILRGSDGAPTAPFHRAQYLAMLLPMLACEGLWSLGENVYAAIYGNMGTDASAAMTLINPVQGLMIGALCGLSQAAGVLVGKLLGEGDFDAAYRAARRLMRYGLLGAVTLSLVLIPAAPVYVTLFRVAPEVRVLARQIMLAYALIAPVKVLNMILGSGVLRSGGQTKYLMVIDILGTWCVGVPVGLAAAFVWRLSIPYVYFLLSLEECVRLALSLVLFRRRSWMHSLETAQGLAPDAET